jgi:hypothetical protein
MSANQSTLDLTRRIIRRLDALGNRLELYQDKVRKAINDPAVHGAPTRSAIC